MYVYILVYFTIYVYVFNMLYYVIFLLWKGGVFMPSEAQKRASINYKKGNIKRVPLDVTIEQHEAIKAFAKKQGKGVNTLIKELLFAAMAADQATSAQDPTE